MNHARHFAVCSGLLAILLVGCAPESDSDPAGEDLTQGAPGNLPPGETQAEGSSVDAMFRSASEEFDVPLAFLQGVAWAETRWNMVDGGEELEGMPASFGIMALRGDALELGASKAGVTVDQAKTDMLANIRAAAAVLSDLADADGIDRADLGDWATVAADYSGADNTEARAYYVHEEVYRAIRQGLELELGTLEAQEVTPKFYALAAAGGPGPNYSPAIWRPSPNYSSRPSGTAGKPQMVIIHTCEGSYSGCWNWLTNSQSGVSAHYVVNSDGSEISQLVDEGKKAWHIAASYKSSLNGGTSSNLDGTSGNSFTIGIEHAGYANQSSWSAGLLASSAALVCDITKDRGIPADKYHVVGHGQLQPNNRIDPGPNWPWTNYLKQVNDICNGGAPPPPDDPQDPPQDPPADPGSLLTIVVDSNNAKNSADALCQVGGSWTPSNNVAGYYGTGYWWRKTGATSEMAEFRAKLSTTKKMRIDAWWTAATDRATAAPFVVIDANGNQLDTINVNQQKNGSQWVTLGTYTLPPGWNVVGLSRWTTAGYVVVADAVRFVEVP